MWQGGWSWSLHRPWGLKTTLEKKKKKTHLTKDAPGVGSLSTYAPGLGRGSQIPETLALEAKLGGFQRQPRAVPEPTLSTDPFPYPLFKPSLSLDSFPQSHFIQGASLPFPGTGP